MDKQSQMKSSLSLTRSHALFDEADELLPGGVNSPVRAFRGVGGTPVFIDHASGPYLYDVDGNRYLDYVQSWGPMILGHTYPSVLEAVRQASTRGFSFGAPTRAESILARLVIESVPSIEMVRFVNSGTEATMSALRLARAYTGRSKIIKFSGCYHGHADMLLVQAGSGVATMGLPDSPGVPREAASNTLIAPYNDSAAVEELFRAYPGDIAAIIVEPAAANMGLVLPLPGFLEKLRSLCSEYGALLVFDEVMTGFRVAYGGAQALYGVTPDLTCLGKIVGGGVPAAAYGGRAEVLSQVAPAGPVYQAGTLSGNPLAMAAGITTLELLRAAPPYAALAERTAYLVQQTERAAQRYGVPVYITSLGSMFTVFFNTRPIHNYDDASTCDIPTFRRYFAAMLQAGIYLAPSQFETGFLSTAHTDEDIEITLRAGAAALQAVAEKA